MIAQTCKECGLLLQAMWFNRDNKRNAWHKFCKRCQSRRPSRHARAQKARKQMAPSRAALQSLSMATASNAGNAWTEPDMVILYDPDMTVIQKALTLRRTYFATESACFANAAKSKRGLGDPERDQWIIDNPNAAHVKDITASIEPPTIPEGQDPTSPAWDWDDDDLKVSA